MLNVVNKQLLDLIASNGGDIAQADIAPAVGISPSSVTRNVKWLGKEHRLPHRAGLQWVVQYQLPKAKVKIGEL